MDIRFAPGARLSAVTAARTTVEAPSARDDGPVGPARSAHAAHDQAVARLQDHVQNVQRELRFRVDEATGQTVVRVVEKPTGRLIRQVPNQSTLDLNAFLQSISGPLLRERA